MSKNKPHKRNIWQITEVSYSPNRKLCRRMTSRHLLSHSLTAVALFNLYCLQIMQQGSYKKSQPFFQDFSRTYQGPNWIFKDHLPGTYFRRWYIKATFPVQANRFLRLQVFAPPPSLHFSVHLSFLVINCFYNRVLQCLKLLYTGKENQSMHSKIGFDASTFKVEENSRTFQGLT